VPLYTVDVNCHCYDPTKTLVLNPAAWVDPPAGTFGNSTAFYNDYRQQRHPVENFNVGRNFTFKERFSFSVRAEFVNMFNRTIFPNPSATTPGTAATCFLSGINGATGACPAGGGSTFASGFGFMQTSNIGGGTRTGQLVARFRF
jgi:hypothetical protein